MVQNQNFRNEFDRQETLKLLKACPFGGGKVQLKAFKKNLKIIAI